MRRSAPGPPQPPPAKRARHAVPQANKTLAKPQGRKPAAAPQGKPSRTRPPGCEPLAAPQGRKLDVPLRAAAAAKMWAKEALNLCRGQASKHSLPPPSLDKRWRVGTDCSGLEAPVHALRAMGFRVEHTFSSESVAFKRDFIRLNSPGVPLCEDILKRDHGDLPQCDLYVCGFPCKPWSSLHSRTKLFKEPGAKVFFEAVRAIRVALPPAAVLENVQGIRKVLPRILQALKKLGYAIVVLDIDPRDAGEPVSRPRVYFVLVRRDLLAVTDAGEIAAIARGVLGESRTAAPLGDRLLPEGCGLLSRFAAPAGPRSKAAAPAGPRSKAGTAWRQQLCSLPRSPLGPRIAGVGERSACMLEVMTAKAGLQRLPADKNIDVSQSLGRCRFTAYVPTITPSAKIVLGCRRRLLSPIEMLLLNGIPVDELVWPSSFESRHFADMAGNTMHCAAAPSLAGHPAARPSILADRPIIRAARPIIRETRSSLAKYFAVRLRVCALCSLRLGRPCCSPCC